MKKLLMALIATVSIVFAGGGIAPVEPSVPVQVVKDKTGFYVGVGLTANQEYVRGESNWFNDDAKAETGYGYNLIAGYKFVQMGDFGASVEARYGQGVWDDNGLDTAQYFVAVKPDYALADTFTIYALAGYGRSDFKGLSTRDGFVYGGGVEYALTDSFGVFGDYVVNPYVKIADEKIENDVITIGVNYKF